MSGNSVEISDSVHGAIAAPAMPSAARAPISMPGLTEYAATIEATPKTAAAASSSRRRPIRSPRLPMVIIRPATMNPYTSKIHSC